MKTQVLYNAISVIQCMSDLLLSASVGKQQIQPVCRCLGWRYSSIQLTCLHTCDEVSRFGCGRLHGVPVYLVISVEFPVYGRRVIAQSITAWVIGTMFEGNLSQETDKYLGNSNYNRKEEDVMGVEWVVTYYTEMFTCIWRGKEYILHLNVGFYNIVLTLFETN